MFYLMFNHSRTGLRLNNFALSRVIKQIQCVVGYVVDQQNTTSNIFLLTNTINQLITILSIKIIIIIIISKLTSVSN